VAVTLREINADNWLAVLRLETLPEQNGFVASNAFSLAEAYVYYPGAIPLAIYNDDTLVGFTMYGLDDDDGNYWIARLMIDRRHQRKGYGRAAMEQIVERLRADPDCSCVQISWEPENTAAGNLYEQLGFRLTGQIIEGEVVARLDF
jgi:diamine N-acetyltransferase